MSLYNEPSTNTAAINTDVVIDLAAPVGPTRRTVKHISWSHNGTPAAVTRMTVESPAGTVLQDWDITAGGPGFMEFPNNGIPGAEGQILRVKMDVAATSNTIATLNILEGSG